MDEKIAQSIMKTIIDCYLNGECDCEEAVDKLFKYVDLLFLLESDATMFTTDCYYTIKHLTETGFETRRVELEYFRDCFNGIRQYNLDEKIKITS
jgi:hypothetical protein